MIEAMEEFARYILILEDDLETLEYILKTLREIEKTRKIVFAVTVLSDYEKTAIFINNNPHVKFDILLLDRDCFKGGSFHVVELENFDLDKVIAISSNPGYNEEAKKRGVKLSIRKEFSNLPAFSKKLKQEIMKLV